MINSMEFWDYENVNGSNWQNRNADEQLLLLEKYYPIGQYFTVMQEDFKIIVLVDGYRYTKYGKYYRIVISDIFGNSNNSLYGKLNNVGVDIVSSIHPGHLKPYLKYNREVKLNKILNEE